MSENVDLEPCAQKKQNKSQRKYGVRIPILRPRESPQQWAFFSAKKIYPQNIRK